MEFCNTGSHGAGAISQVAISALGSTRVVTAVRDAESRLRLIAWDVGQDGHINRPVPPEETGEDAGKVSQIGITSVGNSRVLTAVRDEDGNLRLIVWNVADDGRIRRIGGPTPGFGTATAGSISRVAVTAVEPARVVTAVRDGDRNLRLIVWGLSEEGFLTRLGTGTAGVIDHVAIVTVRGDRVVTAMRNGEGDLQVIAWDISPIGDVTPGPSATAGPVGELAATALPASLSEPQTVVTAMRDGDGNLRLISWRIHNSGDIEKLLVGLAGEISQVAVYSLTRDTVVVGMRDGQKRLRLEGYVASIGVGLEEFARSDTKKEVDISPVLAVTSLGNSRVFTAAKRGDVMIVDVWDLEGSCR